MRRALASIDLTAAPASATPSGSVAAQPAPAQGAQSPIYRRTFVGREAELKQLQGAFDSTLSGSGALVMVVGEPGIGKTTLTEHLGTYVSLRGGRTLVGYCYEEGSLALPYLPFVEAMRTYALDRDREQLTRELGSGAADVARIVSEIQARVAVELPPAGNPEEERFRLFQAVTTFLRNAAQVQALCLVLEDLHDADKATLEMLVHLARHVSGARLLIVGTYRDVQVDRTHPLSSALADLRRLASFNRLALRGLGPGDVHRMLSDIAGQDVPRALADAVHRQTEGNPLFIQEVFRNAAEEGLLRREGGQWVAINADSLIAQIPEGLRDVIGKRISRLSESCNRLLSMAAVIGRDFAVDVLQAVASVSEDELLTALEEAMRVSVLEEQPQAREVRYRFTHAFFRQTLYEEMIAPRRLRLHRQVAQALEAHYATRLEEHAAELADHFSHSSNEDDLQKAVRYSELAAQRAAFVYAHSEAVRLLEQALQVQEVLDPNDAAKRCDLLIALMRSLLSAGEPQRVTETVAPEAFELAERLGDAGRAAAVCSRAIWGITYHNFLAVPVTAPEFRLWIERIDRYAAPETAERAFADLMRAGIHLSLGEMEPCCQLRRQAFKLARRVGDPEILALAGACFIVDEAPPHL